MTTDVLTIADKVELGLIHSNDPRAVRAKKRAEQRVGRPLSYGEWFDINRAALCEEPLYCPLCGFSKETTAVFGHDERKHSKAEQ